MIGRWDLVGDFSELRLKVSEGFGSLTVWPIVDDDLMVSGKSS